MSIAGKRLCIALLLAAAVIGCFHPVVRHRFVNFDDPTYVFNNSHVTSGLSVANVRWAWTTPFFNIWHPLTWISYMLDYQLYGLDPRGFHVTNLLLHVGNTVLLFWVLSRLTGSIWTSAFAAGL